MPNHVLDLPGGNVILYPHPCFDYNPAELFDLLAKETPWEQRSIRIAGKEIPQPRLIAWYSEYSYTYSGLRLEPKPIPPVLQDVMRSMTYLTACDFNGVLLNYYGDGRSSIGMHADDEPEFGPRPTIASLSLGAERVMNFQRIDQSLPIVKVPLFHGSTLVMSGDTQLNWKHGVPKTREEVGPRINLTFRKIVNPR